jgi:hypothetical protein
VGELMNGGRCARDTVSSNGELSPETSGTRSELSDGPFPCLLQAFELIASVAAWDRDALVKRSDMSGRETE